MRKEVVYVDNNATTRVAPEVLEAMLPFLTDFYGNPSSIHTFGGQVREHVQTAREQLASLLGASPEEVIFTSCGTESDNAAILSALENDVRRRKVITSRVEHPAVLSLCKVLQQRGYHVEFVPVNNRGQLCLDALCKMLDDETAIVSVMWANNETGNIYPVLEIADIAHQHGALFHTDAVQAVGKVPINLAKSNIDFLSLSGHKLHAPKGIGGLYVRKGVRFNQFLIGGHQEYGLRAGTENVPGIVALGTAAGLAEQHMTDERTRVAAMRDHLEHGLLKSCPNARVNGSPRSRLPNTTNVSFEYIEGESILLLMNEFNIAASSGSACTSGSLEPSHVLRAMGLPYTALHGSIRFSLSRYNTMDEVELILEKLPPIITRLREISPYGRMAEGDA
ncbi:MAG: cysteine desulfurase NifS [Lentisphaerae bacterium]|jgi:cysteine desulfurase|nr:cysteine desulfurase NifS [Lentisphaerota bacterium]MBT4815013.1 cysteine desulfurase NifS [Lentisphaerota bacterium]MBT5605959.1 cysteine desulfurase NifS [Lentisphaerota bacterium]MBT7060529.1 cysteine desulfurase NifS [Lentisphaerota bacterium]MBT7847982.1 cysteine desulfurase NifS [Lentisphaerota bacterium]